MYEILLTGGDILAVAKLLSENNVVVSFLIAEETGNVVGLIVLVIFDGLMVAVVRNISGHQSTVNLSEIPSSR